MRYRWEECPNPDVNVLHVDAPLPSGHIEASFGPGFSCERLDEHDRELLVSLVGVPGVLSVFTQPYSIQVCKARLFDWPAIRAAVLDRLDRWADCVWGPLEEVGS